MRMCVRSLLTIINNMISSKLFVSNEENEEARELHHFKKTNATVQIKIKGAIERFVSELELSICKINPHGR